MESNIPPTGDEDNAGAPEVEIVCKFFSTLRTVVGTPEVTLTIPPNSTLGSILEQVETRYFAPKNAKFLADDHTRLEVGVICLIDDVDVNLAGGFKKKVTKPCTITLISSLHGG